jgi:hypothetical protein
MKLKKIMAQRLFFSAFALCLCLQSCLYYKRYPLPPQRLKKIDTTGLSFYLIDEEKPKTHCWYVNRMFFEEKTMTCVMERLTEFDAKDVYTVRNSTDAKQSKNEVLLFIDPAQTSNFKDTCTVKIDFDQVKLVEVYENDPAKSVRTTFYWGWLFLLLAASSIGLE